MHDSRNGSAIARRADPDLSASASPVLAPELLLTANIEIERPGRACTPPSPRQRR
jgi:hypothetical protein